MSEKAENVVLPPVVRERSDGTLVVLPFKASLELYLAKKHHEIESLKAQLRETNELACIAAEMLVSHDQEKT